MQSLTAILQAVAEKVNPDLWTIQPHVLPQASLDHFWYVAVLLASIFSTAASYFIMYAS